MRNIISVCTLVLFLSLSLGVASTQEDLCNAEPEIMTTADGVEFVRTPDACFENLPDWDYDAQYVEIDGLRQAYVDVGTGESGETILLLHGQPSWSYLYRKMIPVLAEEGHRVIAMDHLGFGRSDKPIDPDYYTYTDHVERLEAFIQELGLEQASLNIFVQDWGSLIGLQIVGTHPEWFDRVIVGNGFLPTYPEGETLFELPENPELTRNLFHQAITNMPAQQEPLVREPLEIDAFTEFDPEGNFFGVWIDYSRNDERFRPEVIVEAMTYFDLTTEEEAAYAAPFPSREYMGGARAFPGLVNQLGGVTDSGWAGLGEFNKPFLTIWGDNDSGNLGDPAVQQVLINHIPGSDGWDHVRLEEASHFLQDDQGEEIAHRVNEFILQTNEGANTLGNSEEVYPVPSIEQSQFMPLPADLRDFRYCEVLALTMSTGNITISVYNTMGQNDCPNDLWRELDSQAIADENDLLATNLNGPRYWVINGIEGRGTTLAGDVADFGGIEMRWVAQIEMSMADMSSRSSTPYTETEVQRNTTYFYNEGNQVYELTSPDGDVYRMQSYSQRVDPELKIDDLENIGQRLELPEGWQFEARVLTTDEELVTDGIAYVIADELENAYQKITSQNSATEDNSDDETQVNRVLVAGIRNQIIENTTRQEEKAAELQRTDQITTVLCGTASPLAQTGIQTCTAVFVNGQFLLFDIGNNALDSMNRSLLPLEELDAVFITHYHNDHYADLGEVMQWSWIFGRRSILPIHGPTGITQIVDGFSAAYELEATYRTAHHGEGLMPPEWQPSEAVEFMPPEGDEAIVVYENDGVVVKAFRVNHDPVDPSVGYRIEYADKVVVISGDTVRTSSLLENSRGADLLVAEAMNKDFVQTIEEITEELGDEVNAILLHDIQDYHMDVSEVGELAQEAGVQRLALNHLAPAPPSELMANQIFVQPVSAVYDGELLVGTDGMEIVIPLSEQ